MANIDVITSVIDGAESLLDTIKPITLSRYLVDLFRAENVGDYAAAISGLLELYGVFWKFNTDKLVQYKDALFHAVRLLPDVVSEFASFISIKTKEFGHDDLQQQSGDSFSFLTSWIEGLGVSLDSEWTKPLVMIATAVIVGATTIFGGSWLTGPCGWRTAEWIKTVGQTFKNGEFAITGIKNLYNLILQGIGTVFDIEFDSPKGAKLSLIKKISAKTKDLEAYKAACEEDMAEVMLDPSLFDKISRDMEDIIELYEENARADQNMSNVKPLLDHLRELYSLLSDQRKDILSSLTGKQQPAVLWIAGDTGVGKSRFVKDVVEQLAKLEAGYNPTRLLTTYTRSVGDKFWSKYCGQDIVIYDDFGSSKKDEDHFELNQIFTENSYGLNMADVGSKGTNFTSRYVIICSNFKYINRSEGIHNPDILNRRRDMLIEMRSTSLAAYKQQHGKMPPPSWYQGWSHVEFLDTPTLDTGRTQVSQPVSVNTIVKNIHTIQARQRTTYKEHVRQVLKQFRIQQKAFTSTDSNLSSDAVLYIPNVGVQLPTQYEVVVDDSFDSDMEDAYEAFLDEQEQIPVHQDAPMENHCGQPKKKVSFAPRVKKAYIREHKWTWERLFHQTPRLTPKRRVQEKARKLHRWVIDPAYQQIQDDLRLDARITRQFKQHEIEDRENVGLDLDPNVTSPEFIQNMHNPTNVTNVQEPWDEDEMLNQGKELDKCLSTIGAVRIPITILLGPPGTGKTFVMRSLASTFGVPIFTSKDPQVEVLKANHVLLDEIAENQIFFDFVKEFVWAQYDEPTASRIIMTANKTALDARLASYDPDTKQAFLRRVQIIHFDFAYKSMFSWAKYTHADCSATDFENKVVRYKVKSQNLTVPDVLNLLERAVRTTDTTILHHQLIDMPCTWYHSHVKVTTTLDDFYEKTTKVRNPLAWATNFGSLFEIKKGNFLEISRLSAIVFKSMHEQKLMLRTDPMDALVAFNNAKIILGTDTRILLTFDDYEFIILSFKDEPCLIALKDNEIYFDITPSEVHTIQNEQISHISVGAAARSIILKYEERWGSEIIRMRHECNQAIEEAVMELPEVSQLNHWMKLFCFFVKLTVGGALIYRNATKDSLKTLANEGWGSDCEDEPVQATPAYGHQGPQKVPRSAHDGKQYDIYDGTQATSNTARFKHCAVKTRPRMGDTYSENKTDKIASHWTVEAEEFHGKDNPLSNFFACEIYWQDFMFRSVEHAYQYEKASRYKPNIAQEIFSAMTPSKAKNWGRCVEVPKEWHSVKMNVMRELLKIKFDQVRFKKILLATGNEDLHHDVPDKFWGYPGLNKMGFLLMSIRDELKAEMGESDSSVGDPNQSSRRPHHRFKVDRSQTKMVSEAMLDPASGTVADLCSENAVEIWKNGVLICYGLMLQGRHGVTVAHAFDGCNENFTVKHKENMMEATVLVHNKFKDFAIFQVSPKSREFRDIMGHLPSSSEIGKDLSGNPCILQTTVFKGANYAQQRRVVYITAVTTRSVEGKKRYGITYEGHLEGYSYSPMLSKKGDCGSPLIIMNTTFQHKIVGIHCAANDVKGMSAVLTNDILQGLGNFPNSYVNEMLNSASDEHIEILSHQRVEPVEESDHLKFKVFGKCIDDDGNMQEIYNPTKSRVWKSPFHIDIPNADKFEPAVLCHKDKRLEKPQDPYEVAMDKWSHEQPEVDDDLLNSVVESVADHIAYAVYEKRLQLTVLTKNQAINRYTKIKCSNPLYRNSSPGYPFKFWKGASKKTSFLEQTRELTWKISEHEHGRRLHTAVDHLIDRARKGIRTAVVFSGALKDEPVKLKKIYKKLGTRSFAGSPLDYTIAHRMYFHAAAAAIADCRDVLPPQVGIDPRTSEWHGLYCWLTELSPFGFDADFAQWDATVPRAIMERLPVIYNKMYRVNDPDWKQEDDNVRAGLHSSLHGPLLTYHNYVLQAPGGQVSGQPCTAIDNCLINMIYMAYIWTKLARMYAPNLAHYTAFTKHVRYAVYGDDNITSVDETVIGWFNYETFSQAAKQYLNLDVTSAAKDDSATPWKPISELTFLKRSFRQEGKWWVGPLDDSSFSKMLNWTKVNVLHNPDADLHKIKFDPEIIGLTVECALEEACLKDQKFFEFIRDHLVKRCREYGIPMPRIHSRMDYFRKVFHDMNASTQPFESESSFKENQSDV